MKLALLCTLLGISWQAAAVSNYVSDKLVITLRSGQGTTYQILRSLPSGTKLDVLVVEGEYSQVRTEDGLEGWVRNQYLVDEPVAEDKLIQANSRIEKYQAENAQLQKRISELNQSKSGLDGNIKRLDKDNRSMKAELEKLREVAARPIELAKQNETMKKRLLDLEMETQLLSEKNVTLKDRSQRDWFIAGAGVLLAGLFMGLILPKLRRRSSWGELQ